ncbi:MAG: hypothetical protein KDE27_06130 [Planctomycetes bacterium]|nr:hypothetical protein [Planctomycetota bacterium]
MTNSHPLLPRWRRTFTPPSDSTEGILLLFAASRSQIGFEQLSIEPDIVGAEIEVVELGVMLTWPAAAFRGQELRVSIPFAGAAPFLKRSVWIDPTVALLEAAGPPAAPIDLARTILYEQTSAAERVADSIERARSLKHDAPWRRARKFFAELDAATNSALVGHGAFPSVTACLLDILARETDRLCRWLRLQAASSLALTAPPDWSREATELPRVLETVEPLFVHTYGDAAGFDESALRDDFLAFGAGDLVEQGDEPTLRAPDSSNVLCFAGLALRGMRAAGARFAWERAFPHLVHAAALYFARASHHHGACNWHDYEAVDLAIPRPDLAVSVNAFDLPLAPHEASLEGLERLIMRYLGRHARVEAEQA